VCNFTEYFSSLPGVLLGDVIMEEVYLQWEKKIYSCNIDVQYIIADTLCYFKQAKKMPKKCLVQILEPKQVTYIKDWYLCEMVSCKQFVVIKQQKGFSTVLVVEH